MKYVVVPISYARATTVLLLFLIPSVLMAGLDNGAPWSWIRVFYALGALGLGLLARDGLKSLGWWPGRSTVTVTVERGEARGADAA